MCAFDISWVSKSLSDQNQQLAPLLALLSAMKALRTDPSANTPEWFEASDVLVKALDSNIKPGSVDTQDWALLQTNWQDLKSAISNKLSPGLRPFTYKLSEFLLSTTPPATAPGLLLYPLFSGQRQTAANGVVGNLPIQTTASASIAASLSVEASQAAPTQASAIGYVHPEPEYFFRLGLSGTAGGALGADASPAWGRIGGSAAASGTVHLDQCFNYPPSRYLAQVMYDSLKTSPPPGDLSRTFNACQGDDFAMTSMDISGTASLSGKIDAGTVLVNTVASAGAKPSWSPVVLNNPITATANISASFGASWDMNGDHHLTIRQQDHKPVVRLERKINRSTGASFDVAARIGIDGIQAALDPVLNQILPSAQPLIDRLGEFSDIRGMALNALKKELQLTTDDDWTPATQALLNAATGGGAQASQAFADSVKNVLDGYVRNYLNQGGGSLDAAKTALENRIKAELANVPNAALQTRISDTVTRALQAVETKITDQIAALGSKLTQADADITSMIAQALAIPAEKLAEFAGQLQNKVTAATSKLAGWLQSYEAAKARIANIIAQIQSNKLALELAYSYQNNSTSAVVIEVSFTSLTDHSKALYEAFWSGHLERYASLIEACEKEGSAREIQSLFGRSQDRKIQSGMTLNVFDFVTAQSTTSVLDSIQVSADRNGRILVAKDAISIASKTTLNGAVSETSLSLNLEMLAVKDGVPPLNAQFKGSGDNINSAQIDSFFALLEKSNAVRSGNGKLVSDFLYGGPAGTATHVVQANITGTQVLDLDAWKTLLQTTPDRLRAEVQRCCMTSLTDAIAANAERALMDGTPAQWVSAWLDYTGWTEEQFWSNAASSPNSKSWSDSVFLAAASGQTPIPVSNPQTPLAERTSLRRLWEIKRISTGAATAWTAVTAEAQLLAQLPNVPPEIGVTVYDRLSQLSSTINQGFARAFAFDVPDWEQPIKVSWRFLGLMQAMGNLARPGQTSNFIIKVEATEQGSPVARLFA